MDSQTRVSKRAPREFRNWRVQGNPLTLRQPFANPWPTLRQTPRQPFANPLQNLFCQPLSNPHFPWTPGTRLETLVNGFLGKVPQKSSRKIPGKILQNLYREVLNRVGADGVGVKFPIFPVNCSYLPLVLG